jgi:hypothetical protein
VRRLCNYPGFDVMRWLKRLIAEGNDKIHLESINFLVTYIRGNTAKQPDLFLTLAKWSPKADGDGYPPPLQHAALLIPLILTVDEISNFDMTVQETPDIIFPIISAGESLKRSAAFEDIMTLLLHPRQGYDTQITRQAIALLEQTVLGSKRLIEYVKVGIENSKSNKQYFSGSISEKFSNNQFSMNKAHDCLLAFIFIAWAWMLTASPKGTGKRDDGMNMLAEICDRVARLNETHRSKYIRNFLSHLRKASHNAKRKLGLRHGQDKKRLARFGNVVLSLVNMLYNCQKKLSISI